MVNLNWVRWNRLDYKGVTLWHVQNMDNANQVTLCGNRIPVALRVNRLDEFMPQPESEQRCNNCTNNSTYKHGIIDHENETNANREENSSPQDSQFFSEKEGGEVEQTQN